MGITGGRFSASLEFPILELVVANFARAFLYLVRVLISPYLSRGGSGDNEATGAEGYFHACTQLF